LKKDTSEETFLGLLLLHAEVVEEEIRENKFKIFGPCSKQLLGAWMGVKVFHQGGFAASWFSRQPEDTRALLEPHTEVIPFHSSFRWVQSPSKCLKVRIHNALSAVIDPSKPESLKNTILVDNSPRSLNNRWLMTYGDFDNQIELGRVP
jgi:hypothetical protein